MATVKVGWLPYHENNTLTSNMPTYYGWAELASIEPKKLDAWDDSDSNFKKCPAFVNYVNSTYMLCSNIDIELQCKQSTKQ